jgi:hypothetical protein
MAKNAHQAPQHLNGYGNRMDLENNILSPLMELNISAFSIGYSISVAEEKEKPWKLY